MDTLFSIIKTLFLGFFGLIAVLFVLALLFGKRVRKQWDYEAEFRDETGREFGEFDIELSRIDKEETDDTIKCKLSLRHESLRVGANVRVFVGDAMLLDGNVEKAGRIFARETKPKNSMAKPESGMLTRVIVSGVEVASAELVPD